MEDARGRGWLAHAQEAATGTPKRRRRARNSATIPRVRQANLTSCGIAVVAMAAKVTHAEARVAIFGDESRANYVTTYADLRRGLDALGVVRAVRARRFRGWACMTESAIVLIRSSHPDYDHWVLYQHRERGSTVLDPGASGDTLSRSDFSRMKGISYLPVEPIPLAADGARRGVTGKASRS